VLTFPGVAHLLFNESPAAVDATAEFIAAAARA
jgi:hypothetical protein